MTENITTQPVQNRAGGRNRPIGRMFEQLAVNNWVWRVAQLGYAAKGLLYVIVGGTAVLAILDLGRRVRGTGGALNFLLASPFGWLAVAFVAIGLCGYVLRRFIQIVVSPASGTPPDVITRILRRIGFVLSGLAHLGIAITAMELVFGVRSFSSATSTRTWKPVLLTSQFFGVSVIRIAGLAIIGFAIFQFYLAVTRRFVVDLQVENMSDQIRKMTFGFGIAGHAGRGVAFLISGVFLVYAGWFVADIGTGGLSQTLRAFGGAPFGIWVFFAVAAGLTAYGLYLFLAAWYLRLIASW